MKAAKYLLVLLIFWSNSSYANSDKCFEAGTDEPYFEMLENRIDVVTEAVERHFIWVFKKAGHKIGPQNIHFDWYVDDERHYYRYLASFNRSTTVEVELDGQYWDYTVYFYQNPNTNRKFSYWNIAMTEKPIEIFDTTGSLIRRECRVLSRIKNTMGRDTGGIYGEFVFTNRKTGRKIKNLILTTKSFKHTKAYVVD